MIRRLPQGTSLGRFLERGENIKRKALTICIALVAFLLALGIMLYPLISNIYNEQHQSKIYTQYQQMVEQADNSEKERAREKAADYNKTIQPGTQLADAFSNDALIGAAKEYGELLNIAGDGIMGYVNIPVISVRLPIYHGTEDATLEIGIGHLLGSSLPVGGESTHTILTAHSGMASSKMFTDLPQLKTGDVFYLEVLGETLAYQVDQIKTVLPYDTTYLGIEPGADYCTLVTCTPYAVNTHRLLVRGIRIPYEEAEKITEESKHVIEPVVSAWEQEYYKGIFVGLGLVAAIGFVMLAVWLYRRCRHKSR